MRDDQLTDLTLPNVSGKNLQRRKMAFPDDFAGTLNLVFIAFLRRHQDVVDSWVAFVAQLAQQNPGLHYYEFPTLPRNGPLYRWFLNEGMRAGIPDPATRRRTITLYLDKTAFRRALRIDDDRTMWVYLFDRAGRVLWRTGGGFSAEKGAALRTVVHTHLSGSAS